MGIDGWNPDAVRTKWGLITPKGFWRLEQAYKQAIDQGQPTFHIDGNPWVTSFAGHLIEFCRDEGLKPEQGDGTEPVFVGSHISNRDPAQLINLLKAHLDTITGMMAESDGAIHLFKDGEAVALLQWPAIMPDIQAMISGKPS